jgi:sensor c-di-GMP phosphodiesterase-like protein
VGPLHEVTVSFPRRKDWFAVLIGIALAGVPMAAFNLWIDWFIDRQGRQEAGELVRRSLALASKRADVVLDTLADLARRGIDSCAPGHVEAMRQVNFSTTPIKEVSVVDPDGNTLCTDLGIPLGFRQLISSQPFTAGGDIVIEVLRLGDRREAMIRLRRVGTGNALAALMPVDLLLPLTSVPAERSGAVAFALTTRDGSPLVEAGAPQPDAPDDRFVATKQSRRYNLAATVSLPRAQVLAIHGDLRAISVVTSSAVALGIIALALILPTRRRGDPIEEIERAFRAGEFVPYFQPIVDITSGRLRGAEVLLRRRKADGTVALPGTFIPLLESSGLILDVTRALMRRVREEVGAAYARRPKLKIGFNLAAAHFADEAIVRDVREAFEDSPIRLDQVVLEVTERQPLDSLTETRRVIAALQDLGVGIAIDDVGSGHSGLSYILKLGVDLIKIDKMFIDAIGTDRNSATIIETLVELARNLHMEVIAEGVETFEQVVFLRDRGVRSAQGYVFAPPLPGSSFLQLIEAIDPLPQTSAATAGRTSTVAA